MNTFMDNFNQGGRYSAQISSHQAELKREGKFTDQKYLSISSLQTDYLNLDSRSGCGKDIEIANTVKTKCTICGGVNQSTEFFSKGSDRKRKNLVWLVIRTTDKQNGRLGNVLDVNLKIT